MRFALLLLWLTVLAPAAHAADWLAWRRVGEATLTWGPFTVYHSQLRTPNGRYDGPQQDRGHCCKVSDEAAFCLIQRPYISKTLLTRRIS
ncbi:hypothetical protein ACVQIL_26070, partial [Klebsiella pneumoniae]